MHIKMAPNHNFIMNPLPMEPVSRTYQYRKIMKPMLERKRRARINKCLDELKDLMTGTFQADGENVSKLEKADILELTVRHLQRLRESNALFVRNGNEPMNMDKFWAGFQQCAVEVAQFLSKYDHAIGNDLYKHIATYIPQLATAKVAAAAAAAVNYERLTVASNVMRQIPTMTQSLTYMPQQAAITAVPTSNAGIPRTLEAGNIRVAVDDYHTVPRPMRPLTQQSLSPTPSSQCSSPPITQKQRTHPYARAMKMEADGVWRPW